MNDECSRASSKRMKPFVILARNRDKSSGRLQIPCCPCETYSNSFIGLVFRPSSYIDDGIFLVKDLGKLVATSCVASCDNVDLSCMLLGSVCPSRRMLLTTLIRQVFFGQGRSWNEEALAECVTHRE